MSTSTTFAQRLNEAFEARPALSAYAVAKGSGVSQSHISRLRSGKAAQPGYNVILRLAVQLGVSPHWLATGEGPREGMEPLAAVTPLDQALALCQRDISERARQVVVAWADKNQREYTAREWLGICADINRQLATGARLRELRWPDPGDELMVDVTLYVHDDDDDRKAS